MKKTIILILLASCLYAKTIDCDTLSLYFGFAKYTIDKTEQTKIDRFLQSADREAIKSIQFYGYTDTVGTDENNLRLATKRIDCIKGLVDKYQKTIKFNAVGEDHIYPKDAGKRRVDLIIYYKLPSEYVKNTQIFEYLNNDTVFTTKEKNKLYLTGGSLKGKKSIVTVEDLTSRKMMALYDVNTTTDHDLLESVSMFRIKSTDQEGKDVPITNDIRYELKNKPDSTIKLFYGNVQQDSSFKNWSLATSEVNVSEIDVIEVLIQYPVFSAGISNVNNFISKNMRYPPKAVNAGIEGQVFVSFVISENGDTQDITIIKSLSPECDSEVVRVVKLFPKWTPGKQNGKKAKVLKTIPINFTLGYDRGNYMAIAKDLMFSQKFLSDEDYKGGLANKDPLMRYALEQMAFYMQGLTYINCDRFISGPLNNYTFYVDTLSSRNLDCKLILKNYNGVVNYFEVNSSDKSVLFKSMPVNNPVLILASFRIRGYYYTKIMDTNTNVKGLSVKHFEKLTTKQYVDRILNLKF